ncbi:MAG: VOC family protein [Dehalococcoidales bacterium]|nr:VOC family protein [Dehalococcoidales bacterium]
MQKDWKFGHVALIVKDMEAAIKHFEALGVGPFPPMIGGPEGMPLTEGTVRGEPVEYDIDLRICRGGYGGIDLELIQPLKGRTIYDEFLERCGEGMHHVCYNVDDIEKEIAEMQAAGFNVLQTGGIQGVKWAYFDTDRVGGMITELGGRA